MEKKKQQIERSNPQQLDLFQQTCSLKESCSNTYKVEYVSGAAIIEMASYKTKQQVERFYDVVKKLTAHLD